MRERFQLDTVLFCQAPETLLASRREPHLHLSPVHPAMRPGNQPDRLAPRYEGDHAMLLRLQPIGQFAHRCPLATREALDVQ
jgi:hypothetical protein